MSWKNEHGAKIKYVGFSDKVYAPENSANLFSRYSGDVYQTDYNFNPITLDTTHFDTSKVTDMQSMFASASNLTNLDVTHFDTSKVIDMNSMFQNMYSLTNLDVTHFDTRNVTSMQSMFQGMSSLTNLDVTHFDTSKVTNMDSMFQNMSRLTNLDVTHFDTSKVTDMQSMFSDMSSLTSLDVTHFDTSNVTNMDSMFQNMSRLTNLDVTHFDTRNVVRMMNMFSGMSNIKALDVTKFNTSKVMYMQSMFSSMSNLTSLDVTHFDTSKVEDMSSMFLNTSNLTSLDVTHFDTSNVTNMSSMFFGMNSLTSLDITHFDTSNVEYIDGMLSNMFRLKELKLGDKFKPKGINTISETHSYRNKYTNRWHKINDKEHPYSVQDWANSYKADPSTVMGTWVREEAPQESTLIFFGEDFEPVKVKRDEDLPELPRPNLPEPNQAFIGWSKSTDGFPITRFEVEPGETITLYPIWYPVDNEFVNTDIIPITKVYRGDDNLDYGTRTETPGVEGEKTITTTYKVTPYTGELTDPVDKEVITTPMKPTVVKIGTKPKVEMIQRENSDMIRRTTKYTVNPDTGDVTETHIDELPATGTLGTLITIVSAVSLIILTAFLNKFKKTR